MKASTWTILVALLIVSADGTGQSGGPYELSWNTVEGGGTSTGGTYLVRGLAGQPDAGAMTGGSYEIHGGYSGGGDVVSAVDESDPNPGLPASLQLYPNPFNPSTTVRFDLPRAERVHIAVYDVGGRLVHTLLDERRGPGSHRVTWDGTGASGQRLVSGVYLLVMEAGAFREAIKVTLLK